MSDESRSAQRHRTLKGARIVVNDGYSTFDCVIRNMSETGAKLAISSPVGIPRRFGLTLNDGRTFDCEVAWQDGGEIGVRFV